ncbi:MAG: amidohydrolase family protein [Gammaproteobacteria bacterium]
MATLGGASVLRRDDIGSLEPGKVADFVAFRVDDLSHADSLNDPVAALVICAPTRARGSRSSRPGSWLKEDICSVPK